MSEFDAFEQSTNTGQTDDPVADFLAREQNQLAELNDNFDSLGVGNTNLNYGNDMFGSDAGFEATDDMSSFGQVSNVHFQQDAFGDVDQQEGGAASDPYSAVKSVDKLRAEPEKIRIWREEQAERVTKKDAEEEKKKAEWREIARRELEDWYRHRDEQVEKAKKLNRETEEAFVTERDEKKPGGEWERIGRLCDFNPKSSRAGKDVGRMRSILLQLKQSPIPARQ